jgi:feruloyl esterase
MRRKSIIALFRVVLTMTVVGQGVAAAASCESLTSLSGPKATITSAESVAAGAFTPPAGGAGRQGTAFRDLPAFCRVKATLRPTSDSDIKMEIWMPATGWSGRFQGAGSAGMGGAVPLNLIAAALKQGFASAGSDTGHEGAGSDYAPSHAERVIDFGYRAIHEMTLEAKAVVSAFYGKGPRFSYMDGCGGGAQNVESEAQRYPEDYDGLSVTGFSYNTRHKQEQMWIWEAAHKDAASNIPPDKFKVLHTAVLNKCDALDGVKDGVIEDPRRCVFDPKEIECKGADSPSCLTAPQVEAVRKIYAGPTNPRNGERIPAPLPGSELSLPQFVGEKPFAFSEDFYRNFVFKDPSWDYRKNPPNFDSDWALATRPEISSVLDSVDPDLRKFTGRGGKLLMYEGWADGTIPTGLAINYYNNVLDKMGGIKNTRDSVRLFMVPGMSHCGIGEAHGEFDPIKVTEQWVESRKAPDTIKQTRVADGKVVRTRILCQYPQVSTYKGAGSTDDAQNFTCRTL